MSQNDYKIRIALTIVSTLVLLVSLAAPTLTPKPSHNFVKGIWCLYDYNNDGIINPTGKNEIMLVDSPKDCETIGGAIANQRPISYNIKANQLVSRVSNLQNLKKTLKNTSFSTTPITAKAIAYSSVQSSTGLSNPSSNSELVPASSASSASSVLSSASSPASSASSAGSSTASSNDYGSDIIAAVNGPMSGQRAGGKLPARDLSRIKQRIAPPLKGKEYDDTGDEKTSFHCQDFTEVAENAYRELTYAGFDCFLICVRRISIPGVRDKYKILGSFGHSVLDYHKDNAIYFLEPQTANSSELEQYDLDFNNDGKIDAIEAQTVDGIDQRILDHLPTDECSPKRTIVACKIDSFDNRQKAYDYHKKKGSDAVSPPKLKR